MDMAKVRRDGTNLTESPVDEVVSRLSTRGRRSKRNDAEDYLPT
jgi:hypothetical protein